MVRGIAAGTIFYPREAARKLHRYQEHRFLTAELYCKHTQHQYSPVQDSRRRPTEAAVNSGGRINEISNMFINPMPPQPLLFESLSRGSFKEEFPPEIIDSVFADRPDLKFSHLYFDGLLFQGLDNVSAQGLHPEPPAAPVLWNMEYPQPWLRSIAADSGDEDNMDVNFDSDYFPHAGVSSPYQTTVAGVSAVNHGREFGPSHSQHNKEQAESDQMFPPSLPTANAHPRGFGASYHGYDAQQHPWQTHDTAGGAQAANYLNYPDGMPSSNWGHGLQVLGEPLEGPQFSSSSFSSSAPSSATPEAMAMTLDRMTAYANTFGNHPVSNSSPVMDNPGSGWGTGCSSTISPKVLQIRPSPTPTSSSESIHTKILTINNPDLGSPVPKHRHPRSPLSPQRAKPKSRKQLPTKPGKSRPASTASKSSKPSYDSRQFKDRSPTLSQPPTSPQAPSHKSRVAQLKREDLEDMYQVAESTMIAEDRTAKDEFLVKSRQSGIPYKEIHKKGKFTEAESTLRGRYRTLTQPKEARVRNPKWQDKDIDLLKTAFSKLGKGAGKSEPWKQIGDYIWEHGGSYHFAGATCHRKWKELLKREHGLIESSDS
ncbi:hypothetical protein GGR53DRAFT_523951 [Hypoxylon sp. FL1150]|nr:hypothetical protein GGR53DRAFT_523951 [Hypoxylon sp. FL1150]